MNVDAERSPASGYLFLSAQLSFKGWTMLLDDNKDVFLEDDGM